MPNDTHFEDPSYLAAKYVVWQAGKYAEDSALDFLGVGVQMKDPGDIEYIWHVQCIDQNETPTVISEKV